MSDATTNKSTGGDELRNESEESEQRAGFLESLDVQDEIQGKTVDQVAKLIDEHAEEVTDEQIVEQNELLDRDVAEMKQFMDKAVNEGVLVDDTDENVDDGSILLKNKAGDYNPLMDAVTKKRKDLDAKWQTPAVASGKSAEMLDAPSSESKSTVRNAVVLHIPLSGARDVNEAMRYGAAAVQDSVRRGEAPVCPLLQTVTTVGMGQFSAEVDEITAQTLAAFRANIGALRVYVDLDHEQKFSGTFSSTTVLRSLDAKRQKSLERSQRTERETLDNAAESGNNENDADEHGDDDNDDQDLVDPMPEKTRVNRYTRDDDGKPVQEFPDGVAGYASDGRAIPVNNAGADYDPKIPNVLGDMEYRNDLLTSKTYDPKDWYYKRFDKMRWLVVAYMGPKNCNVKYEDYYMCVFGAAKTKADCKKIVDHVRKRKNCFHGRLFNLGAVEIGEWFATAPPRFAKESTASYANPLHQEYMQSYLENQKRTTVEMEQRVLDDEVRARQKTNTLQQQLQEKQMNPELAPNAMQVEADIAQQREADKLAAAEARQKAALAKKKTQEAAERAAAQEKRLKSAPLGEHVRERQPQGAPASASAAVAGGVRRSVPAHVAERRRQLAAKAAAAAAKK
jgi:hypothetical protein